MMGLQLLDKLKNMLEIAKVYGILAQPNNFDIVLWYYFPNKSVRTASIFVQHPNPREVS